jgi:hypothetical protein
LFFYRPCAFSRLGWAEIEIANAVFNRNVGNFFDYQGGVSVMGYSWGGGATFELIERLWDNHEIITHYGVYLDAVQYGLVPADLHFPETRFPEGVFYLLNIYHNHPGIGFRGAEIDENDVTPGSVLEDINTTTEPGFPVTCIISLLMTTHKSGSESYQT